MRSRAFVLAGIALLALASPAAATTVMDLPGDAVAGAYQTYDLTSIDAVFSSTDLTFTLQLTGGVTAPSVNANSGLSGFIDIDVDSNLNTGAASTITVAGTTFAGFGSSGLGIEYYLDLFTESSNPGFVTLKDPINVMNTSQVPISYGATSVTIVVPLSALGNDDGQVNYAVLVGDFGGPTDQAVDALVIQTGGLPAMSSPVAVPEPHTIWLLAGGVATAMAARKRRSRRIA